MKVKGPDLEAVRDCRIVFNLLRSRRKEFLENFFFGLPRTKQLMLLAHLSFIGQMPNIERKFYYPDLAELTLKFVEYLKGLGLNYDEITEKIAKISLDWGLVSVKGIYEEILGD